tara:strand:+ start:517 stop:1278 length:762 start_codon:yes stop_codon:yes gene_type:complete
MKDYYLNDHPLSSSFSIVDEWTTKIGKVKITLPEETRKGLIKFIVQKAYSVKSDSQDQYTDKHFYNMFESSNENDYIAEYEKYTNELVRYYIANAWNVQDVENMSIKSKAFGSVLTYGQRTYPHYHHGYDGVFIHYLTLGNEFTINGHSIKEIEGEPDHGLEFTPDKDIRAPTTHPKIFEQQGNLLLQDPRPSISYPYNRKAIAIVPEVGLSVFHPGYVWHESNPFTNGGIRVAINVKYKIIKKGSQDTYLKL